MSWWWLLIGPVAVYLVVALGQELLAYLRCSKYRSQGFVQHFACFMGQTKFFLPDRSKDPDIWSRYKRIPALAGKAPGLVVNSSPRGKAYVYLTDPALVHEFYLREHEVTKKHEFSPDKRHYLDNFPFNVGPAAEAQRESFISFFKRDTLVDMLQYLQRDVQDHVRRVQRTAQETGTSKNDRFTADWKKPNYELLDHITNTVVFGYSSEPVRVPTDGNKFFCEALKDYLEGPYVATLNSSVNNWLCGIPLKLNLFQSGRQEAALRGALRSIMEQQFNQRAQDSGYQPRPCLVDFRLGLARQTSAGSPVCPTDLLMRETGMYMIASINTTNRLMCGVFYNLALYPHVADKLYAELCRHGLGAGSTKQPTLELLESLTYFDAVLQESMRTLPVFSGSFGRIVLEDFSLGQYNFYKGDVVQVPFTPQFFREEYFPNPERFDPDRFVGGLPASVPPMAYIPFGVGRRMCLGRFLGEAIVKLFVIDVLRQFELSLPDGAAPAKWQASETGWFRENYSVVCKRRTQQ